MLLLNKARAKAAQKKKKGKERALAEPIRKCIVRLYFRAFGTVRNCTNDEDNWPDDWSDIDPDWERERQEYRSFFRRNTPDVEFQLPIDDPLGEVDDLTGHPVARGCKVCREHREQKCSLIEEGVYPCLECTENGDKCELIIPATEKGRCKQCNQDELKRCSFEDKPNQGICDHCAENEHICDALPPDGYRHERIVIDEVIYGNDRPYIACTVCRKEKKRCSLKKKTDKPPCKYCKKHHIGCTFFDLPKEQPKKKKKKEKKNKFITGRVPGPTEGDAPEVSMPGSDLFSADDLRDIYMRDDEPTSREPTPELELEDNAGHKGLLVKIKTSFSHPIQFSGIATNTPDCSFCELPAYGLVGLFEKQVHVIRWNNGLGFSELGGGHAENNGPSTMCQICTIARAQTVACPGHDMRRVFEDGMSPNFDDTFADLLETGDEDSSVTRIQLDRWCSMCFAPATFICCTRQASLTGTDEEEDELTGCGLRLCDLCERRLREEFEGDSGDMAVVLDLEPKAKAGDKEMVGQVVRADVGFLRRDGLLMKYLEYEAEQTE